MEFIYGLFGAILAFFWRNLYNSMYDKPSKSFKELMKREEFRYTTKLEERKKLNQNKVGDNVL